MHTIKELPAWEKLFKKIVWTQLGSVEGKTILDFGSGEGVTANHYAKNNEVVAVEPSIEILKNRWTDYQYEQVIGDVSKLKSYQDQSFDIIICHNVLEYIDDKAEVIHELSRVLKSGGILSIVKHNKAGRVMQMAVLLDDFKKANALLDGKNGVAAKYGPIKYYEDEDISKWNHNLELINISGIRAFYDLQQNQEKHNSDEWQENMFELEMRVSKIDEYRNIAFFHHLIYKKNLHL